MSYPLAVTIRPPNLRKVIVDLSGRPDYLPNVECENGYSLMGWCCARMPSASSVPTAMCCTWHGANWCV
jgi:hypothetical protein